MNGWQEARDKKAKISALLEDGRYAPMKIKEMAHLIDVPDGERAMFAELIDAMAKDGELIISKKGRIMRPEAAGMLRGVFIGNPRGFGFVSPESGAGEDVFIAAENVNDAMNKDVVLCKVIGGAHEDRRAEGEVLRVLKRGNAELVGTFYQEAQQCFVIADDRKIPGPVPVAQKDSKGAVTGHKVAVRLAGEAGNGKGVHGVVTDILGHKDDPGVDIISIARQFGVSGEFEDNVNKELEAVAEEISPEELSGRRDLRGLLTITIDGADTKDVDDAISLEILPDGRFRLGVHIADVTHYVREGSALDEEALRRGTSVYLVDRVIPMLPHKLSNGICSLNPDVDRLALSCVMDVDAHGAVAAHELTPSVIHVDKPINYDQVLEILTDEQSPLRRQYAEFLPMLQGLEELCNILRAKRVRRGAIEFAFPETKIIVDETCNPVDIVPRQRNIATSIIEECMLLCNETIAEEYYWLELPFVFRCHEEPDEEKLRALSEFVRLFGYKLKGQGMHPGSLQALLSKTSSTPEEAIISRVMLRSFKQARYTSQNLGHFGLAAKYYCHFTSPIRRYPDLQIHRIIKKHLAGGNDEYMAELETKLPDICRSCSATERAAESCEREVENLKKAAYMADKIGQSFQGIISGVTGWGVYVELPNTVEGMVSYSNMQDDHYVYDKDRARCVGRRGGKVYSLGDKVTVVVAGVNTEERNIDFLFEK